MQSHTPSFIFGVGFNLATESVFGALNTDTGMINPPVQICYIISENGDFLLSENDNNLIMEMCTGGFVLTETSDIVLTESGDSVLIE